MYTQNTYMCIHGSRSIYGGWLRAQRRIALLPKSACGITLHKVLDLESRVGRRISGDNLDKPSRMNHFACVNLSQKEQKKIANFTWCAALTTYAAHVLAYNATTRTCRQAS